VDPALAEEWRIVARFEALGVPSGTSESDLPYESTCRPFPEAALSSSRGQPHRPPGYAPHDVGWTDKLGVIDGEVTGEQVTMLLRLSALGNEHPIAAALACPHERKLRGLFPGWLRRAGKRASPFDFNIADPESFSAVWDALTSAKPNQAASLSSAADQCVEWDFGVIDADNQSGALDGGQVHGNVDGGVNNGEVGGGRCDSEPAHLFSNTVGGDGDRDSDGDGADDDAEDDCGDDCDSDEDDGDRHIEGGDASGGAGVDTTTGGSPRMITHTPEADLKAKAALFPMEYDASNPISRTWCGLTALAKAVMVGVQDATNEMFVVTRSSMFEPRLSSPDQHYEIMGSDDGTRMLSLSLSLSDFERLFL
jgi:hypothetical protein